MNKTDSFWSLKTIFLLSTQSILAIKLLCAKQFAPYLPSNKRATRPARVRGMEGATEGSGPEGRLGVLEDGTPEGPDPSTF